MRRTCRQISACGGLALALAALGACSNAHPAAPVDPDARSFNGTIISLRYFTHTMMIGTEVHEGSEAFPNQVKVMYDQNTKFLMDGKPTELDKITQYMTVHIDGHMRDGQCFAETANFSSVLPKNVRPAESK